MKLLVWSVALLFTIGWLIAVWIKISRNEYFPRSMFIAVLWWIPEMWVVYSSNLPVYRLLWLMPLAFAIAVTVGTLLLLRHPGRSGAIDTFLVWLATGIEVWPILVFI